MKITDAHQDYGKTCAIMYQEKSKFIKLKGHSINVEAIDCFYFKTFDHEFEHEGALYLYLRERPTPLKFYGPKSLLTSLEKKVKNLC